MRITTLTAAVAVVAASIGTALSAAPTPADARDPDCGVRVVCLWEHNNYKGHVERIPQYRLLGPDGVKVFGSVRGRVSSIINTTSLRICGLAPPDYAVTVNRFSRKPQLHPYLNDRVTRIKRC
jgi:hypothetical protein